MKVDNRKLVYEDIWDDGPSPWQHTVPKPELPTSPELGEEFQPWAAPKNAAKNFALDKMEDFTEEEITRRAEARKKQMQGIPDQGPRVHADQASFLDQRAKELADEEEKAMKEIAGDGDFKPSWHSHNQKKMAETLRKLHPDNRPAPTHSKEKLDISGAAEAPKENKEAQKKHHFAPPARSTAAHAAPPPAPDNELDEMD